MTAALLVMVDRAMFPLLSAMAVAIGEHLDAGRAVDVLDSRKPRQRRLTYHLHRHDIGIRVTDGGGTHRATFADVHAAVAHAEART